MKIENFVIKPGFPGAVLIYIVLLFYLTCHVASFTCHVASFTDCCAHRAVSYHNQNISDDMNYILSQIEKQDGLPVRSSEEEVIRMLWNKRELAYLQLRELDVQLQELQLSDNNLVDGLKVVSPG